MKVQRLERIESRVTAENIKSSAERRNFTPYCIVLIVMPHSLAVFCLGGLSRISQQENIHCFNTLNILHFIPIDIWLPSL